ncbi:MAG: hypothetical protein ACLQLC_08155 [Candidatus Sulfotelmatobacter sp.]
MASPQVAVKSLPDSHFDLLKNEIRYLDKLGKENKFRLGQKLARLKADRCQHRVGSYVRDVHEMKIGGYKRAERLIKFYERVKQIMKANAEQAKKDKAQAAKVGWMWESVEDWERSLEAQGNDRKLADRARLAAESRAEVEEAKERKKQRATEAAATKKERPVPEPEGVNFSLNLTLYIEELAQFAEAWRSLGDDKASQIIFKAVMDAAAKHKNQRG